MKVSEITNLDIARHLRLNESELDENDKKQLDLYLNIAKNYIVNYTGIPLETEVESEETLDSFEDFVIVVFTLCQDMFDNRAMYIDNDKVNKTVQTILDMHVRNNL